MHDSSTSNWVGCNSLAYVTIKCCLGLKEGHGYDFNCFLLPPKGAVFLVCSVVQSVYWTGVGPYTVEHDFSSCLVVFSPAEEENKHNIVRIFSQNR